MITKIIAKKDNRNFKFKFKLFNEKDIESGEWVKYEIINDKLKECSKGSGYTFGEFMNENVIPYVDSYIIH